jgi:hypothetical protein
MTRKERILAAINKDHNMSEDTIDNLIMCAYQMGREDEAKVAGDKIKMHLAAQHDRASKCRYHRMAHQIVGKERIIYLPNYGGEFTDAFGGDETSI